MNAGSATGGGPPLHVVELTQRYPPAIGGVERHVKDLATHLFRAGVSVEVVTSDLYRDRPLTRLPDGPGVEPFPVRRHRAFRAFPAPHGLGVGAPGMVLDALRSRGRILHAHAFGHLPTWAGRLARGLRGSPLVITPHFDRGSGPTLYSRIVARGTLAGADRVVALTRREAAALEELGVDSGRIRVIPNGIGPEDFLPTLPPRPETQTVRILYVGRIDLEQKGLVDLVRAVALLQKPDAVSIHLAGEDWGGASTLFSLARSLGVDERLHWTGPLSSGGIRDEYSSADLFVLPSHLEPFGIVLLEAMAAGLPIVATRVGGIPEIVVEGVTGHLVPPGQPSELARALDRLVYDPSLRRQLGERGRVHARRFAWSTLVPMFLELFHELA